MLKGLNEATEQSALWKGILGKTLAPFFHVSSRARLLFALGWVLGLLGPPAHCQAVLGPSSESGLGTGCAVSVTWLFRSCSKDLENRGNQVGAGGDYCR